MNNGRDMRKAFFSAIRIYLLYIIVPAFLMLVGMMLRGTGVSPDEFFAESGNFYTVVGFAIALWLIKRRCTKKGLSFAEEASLSRYDVNWKKGALLAAVGLGLSLFVSCVITLLPDWMTGTYADTSETLFRGRDQVLAIFGVGLAAPMMEEIIFRGFILNRLLKGFAEKAAVVITAVMFAVLHVNPIWIVYAFLMGLMLGYVSMKEENTVYPILLHVGFNLMSVPINLINQKKELSDILFGNPLLIVIYGLIGLAWAALLLKKYFHNKEEQV